jgi:uncharacterized membrane protein YedE/YeeE
MQEFFESIHSVLSAPWPWYAGGPVIGLTLFLLLFFGKEFGLSANLRVMCAADGAGDYADFFNFDWQSQGWNLMVALGAMFGGYFAATYFGGDNQAHISQAAIDGLNALAGSELLHQGNVPIVPGKVTPQSDVADYWNIYSWGSLFTLRGLIVIVGGGFLIGFGARYAGGCTSGHAISGIADLQLPSLVAVIFFFVGGLITTYLILPYILNISI